MDAPAMERLHNDGKRLVRLTMIEQTANNAYGSVFIPLSEKERVRSKIPIQFDFTFAIRVLFPFLQPFQTVVQRFVTDFVRVMHYLVVVFLTHNFHIQLFLGFNMVCIRFLPFLCNHQVADFVSRRNKGRHGQQVCCGYHRLAGHKSLRLRHVLFRLHTGAICSRCVRTCPRRQYRIPSGSSGSTCRT